jgi:hypothetical protein
MAIELLDEVPTFIEIHKEILKARFVGEFVRFAG